MVSTLSNRAFLSALEPSCVVRSSDSLCRVKPSSEMESFSRPPEPPDPPDSLCRDNDAPHHKSLCAHPQSSSTPISLPPPLSSASDPAPAAARTSLPPRSYSSFSTATDLLAVSPTVISDPVASLPLSYSVPPWIHLSDQPPLSLRCFPSPVDHCLLYSQPPLPLGTPLDEWKELKAGKIHYQVSFGLLVGHLTPGVNDMSLPVDRLVFSAFDAVFGTLQDALDYDIGWCFKDATRKPVALVQFAESHTLKVALIATTILGVRALLRFSNSKSLVMPLNSNGVCNELKPLLHDLRCLSTVFTSILYAFIFCLAIVLANALVLYGLVLNTSSIFGV